jgi:hypothetical protein
VGTLPANPPAGTYAIEVRATDMYGQVFRAHRVIQIESNRSDGAEENQIAPAGES